MIKLDSDIGMIPRSKGTARRAALLGAILGLGATALATGGAGPAAAAILIQSCPFTAMTPGTYILARDLTCPPPAAITVTADGVRLALGGHTLTGAGAGNGVAAEGTTADPITGLQVLNGAVTGFDGGVFVRDAPGARVAGVTATGNLGRGIYVDQSPDALIHGNTARDNLEGIYVEDCDGCRIASNRATGNAREGFSDGIQLDSTTGARVEGNTATGNGDDGIDLTFDSTGNLVRGNRTTGNLGSGIDVGGGSTGNRLVGNLATGNDTNGNGDRDLFDANIGAGCVNTWRGNDFVTDNEGDGPGAGCIR